MKAVVYKGPFDIDRIKPGGRVSVPFNIADDGPVLGRAG
jgi:hypothetical protein